MGCQLPLSTRTLAATRQTLRCSAGPAVFARIPRFAKFQMDSWLVIGFLPPGDGLVFSSALTVRSSIERPLVYEWARRLAYQPWP